MRAISFGGAPLLSKIWSYVDAKQGLIADGLMQTPLQHAAYPNLA